MATRKVILTGIAEWAKVFEDNRDLKGFEGAYEEFDGACTIDMILDKENMDRLSASRSMKKGSADAEGRGTRVRFVRKFNTGRDWDSGSPVVLKSDGTKWDMDVDGLIGNGSTVTVTLSVYDTSRKSIVGTRLDRVKVLEHIKPPSDDEDEVAAMPPPQKLKVVQGEEEVPF
mgnify:FL=1|tara:strand:+ start:1986 stop:2501 length:516 start_codon:yes stop_codon:yes gene_type:complete